MRGLVLAFKELASAQRGGSQVEDGERAERLEAKRLRFRSGAVRRDHLLELVHATAVIEHAQGLDDGRALVGRPAAVEQEDDQLGGSFAQPGILDGLDRGQAEGGIGFVQQAEQPGRSLVALDAAHRGQRDEAGQLYCLRLAWIGGQVVDHRIEIERRIEQVIGAGADQGRALLDAQVRVFQQGRDGLGRGPGAQASERIHDQVQLLLHAGIGQGEEPLDTGLAHALDGPNQAVAQIKVLAVVEGEGVNKVLGGGRSPDPAHGQRYGAAHGRVRIGQDLEQSGVDAAVAWCGVQAERLGSESAQVGLPGRQQAHACSADVVIPERAQHAQGGIARKLELVGASQDPDECGPVFVAPLAQHLLDLEAVPGVGPGQGLEQLLIAQLADGVPAVQAARRQGRFVPGAAPGEAIDAAILAVAPEPAGAAGVRAPVDNVHGAVGPQDHLAWTKQRVVAAQERKLLDDLEGGADALDLVGADHLAENIGIVQQAAVVFGKAGVIVNEQARGSAAAGLGQGRQLAGQLAEDGAADVIGDAAARAAAQPPAEVGALGHVHEPAAGELAAVLVVVVGMEDVAGQVKSDVAIRIAVADRVSVHPGAVGPAAEDGPGAQHRGPAAVGALDHVVIVAGGNVEPAVGADGHAGHLVVMEAAKALGDDFLDVVGAARLALLETAHRAPAGQINPAVVQQDAGGQLVFEDDFGLIPGAGAPGVLEDLDDVLDVLLHGGDLANGAVLVSESLHEFLRIGARVGPPFEDMGRAVGGKGHADGIDHGGSLADDFDFDAFGRLVALEARIALALVNNLEPGRRRLGGCLGLSEIDLVRRGQASGQSQ